MRNLTSGEDENVCSRPTPWRRSGVRGRTCVRRIVPCPGRSLPLREPSFPSSSRESVIDVQQRIARHRTGARPSAALETGPDHSIFPFLWWCPSSDFKLGGSSGCPDAWDASRLPPLGSLQSSPRERGGQVRARALPRSPALHNLKRPRGRWSTLTRRHLQLCRPFMSSFLCSPVPARLPAASPVISRWAQDIPSPPPLVPRRGCTFRCVCQDFAARSPCLPSVPVAWSRACARGSERRMLRSRRQWVR